MTSLPEKRSHIPLASMMSSTSLSVTGNAMMFVLIPWLVLRQTGNAAAAGAIDSVAAIAAAVAMLFGGALVDRWDRRWLSIGADILSSLAVAAIPLVDLLFGLDIVWIIVLVAVGAIFDGPGMAAREALRPAIAKRADRNIASVNSWGEVVDGLGGIAGPALAGALVAVVSLDAAFWVTSVMFLLAAIFFCPTLWTLAVPQGNQEEQESVWRSTVAGFNYVWRSQLLRTLSLITACFGILLGPLMLVFAAHFEAQDNPGGLGALVTAFGVGGVIGAVAYALVATKVPRRPVLLISLLGAGVGLGAMSALLDDMTWLLVAAAVTGLTSGPVNPVLNTAIQLETEDAYRGRVLSTLTTLSMLAAPLGMTVGGVVIELTSPQTAFAGIAVGVTLVAVWALFSKGLRGLSGQLAAE